METFKTKSKRKEEEEGKNGERRNGEYDTALTVQSKDKP
jgi:hypothetical protein